jgi:peptide/nickel transport system permease protein
MWVYIARRLLWLPFLLFAASIITFTLGRFAPGDPVEVILGNRYTPEAAARLRQSLKLDKPFIVQYADYMWRAFHGDFGESIRYRGRSVGSLLASRIWVSVQVNAAAMIVSLGIGLPLGFWIAHRQGRWEDPFSVATAVILMSIPVMVSIPFLLWAFCLKLGWIPCSGWGGFFDARMIIPAIAMGIPGVAGFARLMRASTLDVLGQDFIRTARSKGLSEFTVNSVHVLKNALIPIVTILAFALAGMLSTGFITETILGIPGVGRFAVQSIFDRDYPVIMAITLLGAGVFVIANLVADITYAIVDPRIHYQ